MSLETAKIQYSRQLVQALRQASLGFDIIAAVLRSSRPLHVFGDKPDTFSASAASFPVMQSSDVSAIAKYCNMPFETNIY